jgi:hypothetical protein
MPAALLPDPLTLDASYPDAETRTGNPAGTVRFITAADAGTLSAHQREIGDIILRTNLIVNAYNSLLQSVAQNPYFNRTLLEQGLIKADGTISFTAPVSGIAPTESAHLVTLGYLNTALNTILTSFSNLTSLVNGYVNAAPVMRFTDWTTHVWAGGTKQALTFDFSAYTTMDLDKLASISVMEKLDIAVPTLSNPTPTPVYVYRNLLEGSGFQMSDWWVSGDRILHLMVPNSVFYQAGYPSGSGYTATQTINSRKLKAILTCHP